jgi:DNA (cytosine-5)-methyltransferase 3A
MTMKRKKITAVSLFNGMSTGRLALENAGFKIKKYYSSEIKPYAIKLCQHHHPDTIQVGDVTKWREWDIDWKSVDILLSGSPCQDLSIAGNGAGIHGEKSKLFWVFIDILNHCKKLNPQVLFLQENVGSASKLDIGIMSRALGVYPVRINSSLVTAQLRDRYYWTNARTKQTMFDVVTDIPQPENRKITFQSILVSGLTNRTKCTALAEKQSTSAQYKDYHSEKFQKYAKSRDAIGMLPVVLESKGLVSIVDGQYRVQTNTVKGYDVLTENDCLNLAFASSKTRRGRVTKGKSPCLFKGNEPLYGISDGHLRLLNKVELCRLQGFPDEYCDILSRNHSASLLGDGWTLPVIEHIFSFFKIQS